LYATALAVNFASSAGAASCQLAGTPAGVRNSRAQLPLIADEGDWRKVERYVHKKVAKLE